MFFNYFLSKLLAAPTRQFRPSPTNKPISVEPLHENTYTKLNKSFEIHSLVV